MDLVNYIIGTSESLQGKKLRYFENSVVEAKGFHQCQELQE